jgi:hypothetical protein
MSIAITQPAADPRPSNWRQTRWLALIEFALVAFIFYADFKHLLPVSKTPALLVLGWISLRVRRLRWRNVGLTRKHKWPTLLAFGVGAGLVIEGIELFISQPLLIHFTHKQPDLSDFRALHGNVKLLLLGFLLTWTLAAFGEEMVWRGWLMNRVAGLGKRTKLAWIVSLILVNIGFGFAHAYQGVTGIIDEGFMGLLLGIIYLTADGDLFVPIIAHGVQDTIDLLLIFFGLYPGL